MTSHHGKWAGAFACIAIAAASSPAFAERLGAHLRYGKYHCTVDGKTNEDVELKAGDDVHHAWLSRPQWGQLLTIASDGSLEARSAGGPMGDVSTNVWMDDAGKLQLWTTYNDKHKLTKAACDFAAPLTPPPPPPPPPAKK